MSQPLDEQVYAVLKGQSRDYFIYPNAAAFAAEGLDPEQVAAELARLEAGGIAERELVTIVTGYDDTGEEITDQIGGGYRLLAVPNPPE